MCIYIYIHIYVCINVFIYILEHGHQYINSAFFCAQYLGWMTIPHDIHHDGTYVFICFSGGDGAVDEHPKRELEHHWVSIKIQWRIVGGSKSMVLVDYLRILKIQSAHGSIGHYL